MGQLFGGPGTGVEILKSLSIPAAILLPALLGLTGVVDYKYIVGTYLVGGVVGGLYVMHWATRED